MTDENKTMTAPLTPEELLQLELLVDGELDQEQRRALLVRLDEVPNGWRLCAAAFLESQCFRESIPQALGPAPLQAESPTVNLPLSGALLQSRNKRAKGWRLGLLATAACGLFLCGILTITNQNLHLSQKENIQNFPEAIVSSPVEETIAQQDRSVVHSSIEASPLADEAVASRSLMLKNNTKEPIVLRPTATPQLQQVTITSPKNHLDRLQVPCVESDQYDPELLNADAANYCAEQLRQEGHDVETVSEQLMFPLNDGRRVIVPVDTINVRYKTGTAPIL